MTFAEGFYEYFRACPLLEGKKLNFDYHSPDPGEYFLETDAPDTLVRRYAHGSAVWQKPIYLCLVCTIGQDSRIQIKNKVEFELFRDWVEEQNLQQKWPTLPENCHPISLECTTDGYAFGEQESTAQYQIQMLLTYQRNPRR